jgi:hypothetical protein
VYLIQEEIPASDTALPAIVSLRFVRSEVVAVMGATLRMETGGFSEMFMHNTIRLHDVIHQWTAILAGRNGVHKQIIT